MGPLPGIAVDVVDNDGASVGETGGGFLTLSEPWPAMLRGIWGDEQRYRETYWSKFEGQYFAGDGAKWDDEAASPPALAAWWAIGAGALLGIAAHLANVLPDLDDDRRTGVRGLPHRLGTRASGLLTWVVLLLAAILLVGGPGVTPLGIAGLGVNAVIAASGAALVLTRPPSRTLFRLIITAALVDVVLLAIAGPH